jgi:hypothetical protein
MERMTAMDFERDYILRMIQMMGDFMRRIAEKMDDFERGRMLDEESRRLCGVPFAAGESMDGESLIGLLPPVPRMMMSELLFIKARTASDLAWGEGDALMLKSLRLLSSLHGEPRLCELRAGRLIELKEAVLSSLTAGDLMDCARFFAQAERYDAMEDALFQARDGLAGEARAAAAAEGAELLRRAAKAPERTLALCGMTGRELREAARELEAEIP